jgi:methyl-accepting chemotaxis protein
MKRIFRRITQAHLVKQMFNIQWFLNLKISAKLTLGFVVFAMIAGMIGLVGALNIAQINHAGHEVYQMDTSVLGPLHKISTELLKIRINTAFHVLKPKDKFRYECKNYEYEIETAQTNINKQLADLKTNNKRITEQLNNLENVFATYWQEEARVLKLSNENKIDEASGLMDQKLKSLSDTVDWIMDSLFTMSDTDAKNKTEANYIAARWTIGFMLALVALGIFIALGLGMFISRLISKPIKQLTATAEQLASGDLNVTITPVNAKDETAILTNTFANMTNSLQDLVTGINEDSNVLYSASQELKNASNDTGKSAAEVAKTMEELAQASSEQAGQTNEAVNSINVLAELVRQVSNEVANIAAESKNVSQFAKLGEKATKDVADEIVKIYNMTQDITRVIEELNQSAVEISSITAVIQNIAEQTTLLALNAAIESARAGEYGRGFGVVATETGKLAEQTKQAAQLISNVINKMSERSKHVVQSMDRGMAVVESGKNLAVDATVTFENIFNQLDNILKRIDRVAVSAQKMADRNEGMIGIITNIAALSEESMASTQEVSAASEEQSASVEQVNTLAENLAVISGKLQQSVAQFKIVEIVRLD